MLAEMDAKSAACFPQSWCLMHVESDMRKFAVILLSLLLSGLQPSAAEPSNDTSLVVAQVLGKQIAASDIGLKYNARHNPIIPKDEASCLVSDPVEELQKQITAEVVQDYVSRKHLKATDEEIRELQVYQDNSLAQDRVRRQKELVQLEERLKTTALNPKEKEQAEKQRATLLRLAEREKKLDTMSKPSAEELRSVYAPWIEAWKFNKSVYKEYGGMVAITKFGPDPVEATRRLLAEYEKDKKLVIFNADLKSSFWSRLAKPPRFTAKQGEIDFTPSWRKPVTKDGN